MKLKILMNKYYVNNPIVIEQNLNYILLLKFLQTDINSVLSNLGINIITPLLINKKGKKIDIIISLLEQVDLVKNENIEFDYISKEELKYDDKLEDIVNILIDDKEDFLVEILNNKVVIMR